jgi:Transglutaminase-like superfamily
MTFFAGRCLAALAIVGSLPATHASCRSNDTHISWKCNDDPQIKQQRSLLWCTNGCWIQTRAEAEHDAIKFLRNNVMAFDLAKLETLGFATDTDAPDGLDYGLIGPSIKLALDTKANFTWTDDLPRGIFYEYVMSYAHTNEGRTNWRPLLKQAVDPLILSAASINDVVVALNTHIWTVLAPSRTDSIVFVGGQTPLIFDPMSVIAFGYASCTGLAVLFASALRAAGVPARVVGTPAWLGQRDNGNHNWVEVYDDGEWKFMEPSPKQATIDSLERNPCERWFCHKDRFNETVTTPVYAARLDHSRNKTTYPLAWEWASKDVPGDDRTEYYTDVCSKC